MDSLQRMTSTAADCTLQLKVAADRQSHDACGVLSWVRSAQLKTSEAHVLTPYVHTNPMTGQERMLQQQVWWREDCTLPLGSYTSSRLSLSYAASAVSAG